MSHLKQTFIKKYCGKRPQTVCSRRDSTEECGQETTQQRLKPSTMTAALLRTAGNQEAAAAAAAAEHHCVKILSVARGMTKGYQDRFYKFPLQRSLSKVVCQISLTGSLISL